MGRLTTPATLEKERAMRKELEKSIKHLKECLKDPYLSREIKQEIEDDLEFLEKLHHALYFYH